jgi:hypothetical protein
MDSHIFFCSLSGCDSINSTFVFLCVTGHSASNVATCFISMSTAYLSMELGSFFFYPEIPQNVKARTRCEVCDWQWRSISRVAGCRNAWRRKWEIPGSGSGAAEDSGLPGCDAVSLGCICRRFERSYCLHLQRTVNPKTNFIWLVHPENVGTTIFRNVGNYSKTQRHTLEKCCESLVPRIL